MYWAFFVFICYLVSQIVVYGYRAMTAPPAQYEQPTKMSLPDGSHVIIYIEPGTNKLCRAYSLGGISCD